MTANKHYKHLVRARMAASGETYTEASEHVRGALGTIVLGEPTTVEVHGRHGQSVIFTPDGSRLLSAGQDARIVVLDPRTGDSVGELLGHHKVVNALATSPDGGTLVSVSSDRTVRLWDLEALEQRAVLEGHRDAVVALAVSPDGSQALTGGYDGRLRRWQLADGTCLDEHRSTLPRIAALAYSPDGAYTLESGQGPRVAVRDRRGEPLTELDTGAPGVTGLAVAPGGELVATAGSDGTVGLWSCDTWERVRALPAGDRVHAVAFSRGGHLLAAAAAGRIVVWSHEADEPVATCRLPIKGVYALAFSPDTRRLAQTGADGKVRIWALR